MGRVAARTHGGHGQALAEQAFAMNGHGIIFQDILPWNIMGSGHGTAFLMAATTGEGDIKNVGRRPLIGTRQDEMLGVAVIAARRVFVVGCHRLAV